MSAGSRGQFKTLMRASAKLPHALSIVCVCMRVLPIVRTHVHCIIVCTYNRLRIGFLIIDGDLRYFFRADGSPTASECSKFLGDYILANIRHSRLGITFHKYLS